MRFACGLVAALFVLVCVPASAQGWSEYRNTDEGFLVNLPTDPKVETMTYTTQSGASVPARVFSSAEEMNRYSMTVVNLTTSAADDDGAKAMAHEASVMRRRGQIRFDESSELDGIHGHQLSIVEPSGRRVLIQLYYYNHKLYIAEGNTAPGAFEAALFQTSVAMIHPDGRVVNLTREAREREAAQGKAAPQ
jgi:hypothetical protein